jgi:acetyl esterase/lipase
VWFPLLMTLAGLTGGVREARGDGFDDLRRKLGDVEAQAKNALSSLVPGIERDICYGEVDGQRLMLDIYRPPGHDPASDKPRPGILVLHGGGWSAGSRNEPVCAALALSLLRDRFVVFNIDYRLVQPATAGQPAKNVFPAAFDDCQRAVRWVRAHAAPYGVRQSRLGAIGVSAGGHLAALLGTRPTRDNSDPALSGFSSRVQAVVSLFGPADLTRDFSHLKFAGGSVQDLVDNFAGTGPADRRREASPIFQINARTSPMLLFHGDRDDVVPVEQGRDFHSALQSAGRESRYVEFAGEGHAVRKPENIERLNREVSEFFKRHLLAGSRSGPGAEMPPAADGRTK